MSARGIFLEEVTKDFQSPKEVKIHDITLRDGEQQAGIIFTRDDKIRIAEKLSEVGMAFGYVKELRLRDLMEIQKC